MEMEKWKSGRKIIVKARRGLPQVAAADGECSMVMMMMVMIWHWVFTEMPPMRYF